MTAFLYKKDDEGEYIKHSFEATDVAHALTQGFVAEIPSEPEDKDLFAEKYGDADNKEVRELAEAAGVDGFATAKINTLKQAILDADQD